MPNTNMIVTCLRCGSYYNMDMEPSLDDHHNRPNGWPCIPASGCDYVSDTIGTYCRADHGHEDWEVEEIEV